MLKIHIRLKTILKTIELLVDGKTDAALNECNRAVK